MNLHEDVIQTSCFKITMKAQTNKNEQMLVKILLHCYYWTTVLSAFLFVSKITKKYFIYQC